MQENRNYMISPSNLPDSLPFYQTVHSAEEKKFNENIIKHFLVKALEEQKARSLKPISAVVVGTPYVDISYKVSDEFLVKHGLEKDQWSRVEDPIAFNALLQSAEKEDPNPIRNTGGSGSNTMKVLAALQNPVAFLGKLGGNDPSSQFYRDVVRRLKVHLRTEPSTQPMSQIAIFVTPDSKRTMVCFPNRSLDLSPQAVLSKNPFQNAKSVHFEGYMIEEFSFPFILSAIKEAKKAGATVSFDLGAARLASEHKPQILELLTYVDIVFANESEANALLDCSTYEALHILSSYPYCSKAVIFQGENGALIRSRNQEAFSSPAITANKVDSTGCGDAFIGGFLHGLLQGCSLEECAWIGNLLGGTAVGIAGSEIPQGLWPSLIRKIQNHLSEEKMEI